MDKTIISPVQKTNLKVFPVECASVKIKGFFSRYISKNRKVSIPLLYKLFEKYGTVDNFRIVAGLKKGEITRRLATDSDFYKFLEAISWDFQNYHDHKRLKFLDTNIELISKAQEKDGYIDTYYTDEFKNQRFKKLENSHELYCGGHLIQAAIAHFRSTGKENFLNIAIKWADYIFKKFEKKQITKNDGHPEVEMALVELYRTTGNESYLKLAGELMGMPYYYLGCNFLGLNEIKGHAVRMMYLLCGATDYYLETMDKKYYIKIKQLWNDLCSGKYYITGGIGSRYQGEAFGLRYELPNLMGYCESCASIALMMWLYRMFFVEQNLQYFDLFEKVLYNSFLASVSLDGKKYFYVNPLASIGNHQRNNWYRTTCCPPNIQRFIASLPGYFYAKGKKEIWINLYDKNQAILNLENGNTVIINMETDYPWDGKVCINIQKQFPENIKLHLRIPEWSEKTCIRYMKKSYYPKSSSYFTLDISNQDVFIEIDFNIKSEFYFSNPAIESNRNCVAIKRGPVVYCLEGHDNSFDVFNLFIPEQSLNEKYEDLLNGIVSIHGYGFLNKSTKMLYTKGFLSYKFKKVKFKAIPYFVWCNRGPTKMIVWINSFKGSK